MSCSFYAFLSVKGRDKIVCVNLVKKGMIDKEKIYGTAIIL